MIRLSSEAEAQLDRLVAHYEAKERVAAAINLLSALDRAKQRITRTPEAGLEAPRPYPALKRQGRRWIIEGRYWSLSVIQCARHNQRQGAYYAEQSEENRS